MVSRFGIFNLDTNTETSPENKNYQNSPAMSLSPTHSNCSTQLNGVDDVSVDVYLRSLENRVRYMNKADLVVNAKLFKEELACAALEDEDYELKLAVLEMVTYLLTSFFNISGSAKTGNKKKRRKTTWNDNGKQRKKSKRDHCKRQIFTYETCHKKCNLTPLDDMTSSWILERNE